MCDKGWSKLAKNSVTYFMDGPYIAPIMVETIQYSPPSAKSPGVELLTILTMLTAVYQVIFLSQSLSIPVTSHLRRSNRVISITAKRLWNGLPAELRRLFYLHHNFQSQNHH